MSGTTGAWLFNFRIFVTHFWPGHWYYSSIHWLKIETFKVCSLAPLVRFNVTLQASWLWFFVLSQHPLEKTQILTSSVWRWHWTLLRKRWIELIKSLWIVQIHIQKLTVLSAHNVLCTWYDSTISTFLCLWLGNLSNGVHSVLLLATGKLA